MSSFLKNLSIKKLYALQRATEMMRLNKSKLKNSIFVYTPPKVGSTSIVSSMRTFIGHKFNIIHIHDERMLETFTGIKGISVMELINYTKHKLNHDVYVIDVYRNPIERKMSVFFEKITTFHFNTTPQKLANYPIQKLIHRFNCLFPHLGKDDWFLDKFNIPIPNTFDTKNKYIKIIHDEICYIKLRLCDSTHWSEILSSIFKINIRIISDYEGKKKEISHIYDQFKREYKIPANLLVSLKNQLDIKYFLSASEFEIYFSAWKSKSTHEYTPFNELQYDVYLQISKENQIQADSVQHMHYRDEGCRCQKCNLERQQMVRKILSGKFQGNETVWHKK